MKKLVLLAGVAAAAFGAMKLLRGKEEEQGFETETYTAPQPQA